MRVTINFNFYDKRKSHVKKTGIHMAVWGGGNVNRKEEEEIRKQIIEW